MDIINAKLNELAERLARIEAKLDALLDTLEEEDDEQMLDDGPFGRSRQGELL